MRNSTDVELAGIDSESAVGVGFKLDARLDEKYESSFQVALLYTSAAGQRLIRVLNLSLSNTSSMSTYFRYADLETTVLYLSKQSTELYIVG